MLLPDDIHPEQTVYYNGAYVLEALKEGEERSVLDLYAQTKRHKEMSMPTFALCLDWLFLLDLIEFNEKGMIHLCS